MCKYDTGTCLQLGGTAACTLRLNSTATIMYTAHHGLDNLRWHMEHMHHIGSFYVAVTKMPDRNNTRGEGSYFILAHSFAPQLPCVPSKDIMVVGM